MSSINDFNPNLSTRTNISPIQPGIHSVSKSSSLVVHKLTNEHYKQLAEKGSVEIEGAEYQLASLFIEENFSVEQLARSSKEVIHEAREALKGISDDAARAPHLSKLQHARSLLAHRSLEKDHYDQLIAKGEANVDGQIVSLREAHKDPSFSNEELVASSFRFLTKNESNPNMKEAEARARQIAGEPSFKSLFSDKNYKELAATGKTSYSGAELHIKPATKSSDFVPAQLRSVANQVLAENRNKLATAKPEERQGIAKEIWHAKRAIKLADKIERQQASPKGFMRSTLTKIGAKWNSMKSIFNKPPEKALFVEQTAAVTEAYIEAKSHQSSASFLTNLKENYSLIEEQVKGRPDLEKPWKETKIALAEGKLDKAQEAFKHLQAQIVKSPYFYSGAGVPKDQYFAKLDRRAEEGSLSQLETLLFSQKDLLQRTMEKEGSSPAAVAAYSKLTILYLTNADENLIKQTFDSIKADSFSFYAASEKLAHPNEAPSTFVQQLESHSPYLENLPTPLNEQWRAVKQALVSGDEGLAQSKYQELQNSLNPIGSVGNHSSISDKDFFAYLNSTRSSVSAGLSKDRLQEWGAVAEASPDPKVASAWEQFKLLHLLGMPPSKKLLVLFEEEKRLQETERGIKEDAPNPAKLLFGLNHRAVQALNGSIDPAFSKQWQLVKRLVRTGQPELAEQEFEKLKNLAEESALPIGTFADADFLSGLKPGMKSKIEVYHNLIKTITPPKDNWEEYRLKTWEKAKALALLGDEKGALNLANDAIQDLFALYLNSPSTPDPLNLKAVAPAIADYAAINPEVSKEWKEVIDALINKDESRAQKHLEVVKYQIAISQNTKVPIRDFQELIQERSSTYSPLARARFVDQRAKIQAEVGKNPDKAARWHSAQFLLVLGKEKEALIHLDSLLQEYPEMAIAASYSHPALMQLKEHFKTVSALVEANPKLKKEWNQLQQAIQQNKPETEVLKAFSAFTAAMAKLPLKLDKPPTYPQFEGALNKLYNSGSLPHLSLILFTKREAVNKLIEDSKNEALISDWNRAKLLYLLGDTGQAEAVFKQVLAQLPDESLKKAFDYISLQNVSQIEFGRDKTKYPVKSLQDIPAIKPFEIDSSKPPTYTEVVGLLQNSIGGNRTNYDLLKIDLKPNSGVGAENVGRLHSRASPKLDASHIVLSSNHSARHYIASAAPTEETVHEYFDTLIANNSRIIVDLKENGEAHMHGFELLPRKVGEAKIHGKGNEMTQVTLLQQEHRQVLEAEDQISFITQSTILVKRGNKPPVQMVVVGVRNWADFAPPDVQVMRQATADVLELQKTYGSCTAVNCKGGEGRTGTEILYMESLAQYKEAKTQSPDKPVNINPMAIYLQYNGQRNSIQNEGQFAAVYEALAQEMKGETAVQPFRPLPVAKPGEKVSGEMKIAGALLNPTLLKEMAHILSFYSSHNPGKNPMDELAKIEAQNISKFFEGVTLFEIAQYAHLLDKLNPETRQFLQYLLDQGITFKEYTQTMDRYLKDQPSGMTAAQVLLTGDIATLHKAFPDSVGYDPFLTFATRKTFTFGGEPVNQKEGLKNIKEWVEGDLTNEAKKKIASQHGITFSAPRPKPEKKLEQHTLKRSLANKSEMKKYFSDLSPGGLVTVITESSTHLNSLGKLALEDISQIPPELFAFSSAKVLEELDPQILTAFTPQQWMHLSENLDGNQLEKYLSDELLKKMMKDKNVDLVKLAITLAEKSPKLFMESQIITRLNDAQLTAFPESLLLNAAKEKPDLISHLPVALFQKLSPETLGKMSPQAIGLLQASHFVAMTSAQIEAVPLSFLQATKFAEWSTLPSFISKVLNRSDSGGLATGVSDGIVQSINFSSFNEQQLASMPHDWFNKMTIDQFGVVVQRLNETNRFDLLAVNLYNLNKLINQEPKKLSLLLSDVDSEHKKELGLIQVATETNQMILALEEELLEHQVDSEQSEARLEVIDALKEKLLATVQSLSPNALIYLEATHLADKPSIASREGTKQSGKDSATTKVEMPAARTPLQALGDRAIKLSDEQLKMAVHFTGFAPIHQYSTDEKYQRVYEHVLSLNSYKSDALDFGQIGPEHINTVLSRPLSKEQFRAIPPKVFSKISLELLSSPSFENILPTQAQKLTSEQLEHVNKKAFLVFSDEEMLARFPTAFKRSDVSELPKDLFESVSTELRDEIPIEKLSSGQLSRIPPEVWIGLPLEKFELLLNKYPNSSIHFLSSNAALWDEIKQNPEKYELMKAYSEKQSTNQEYPIDLVVGEGLLKLSTETLLKITPSHLMFADPAAIRQLPTSTIQDLTVEQLLFLLPHLTKQQLQAINTKEKNKIEQRVISPKTTVKIEGLEYRRNAVPLKYAYADQLQKSGYGYESTQDHAVSTLKTGLYGDPPIVSKKIGGTKQRDQARLGVSPTTFSIGSFEGGILLATPNSSSEQAKVLNEFNTDIQRLLKLQLGKLPANPSEYQVKTAIREVALVLHQLQLSGKPDMLNSLSLALKVEINGKPTLFTLNMGKNSIVALHKDGDNSPTMEIVAKPNPVEIGANLPLEQIQVDSHSIEPDTKLVMLSPIAYQLLQEPEVEVPKAKKGISFADADEGAPLVKHKPGDVVSPGRRIRKSVAFGGEERAVTKHEPKDIKAAAPKKGALKQAKREAPNLILNDLYNNNLDGAAQAMLQNAKDRRIFKNSYDLWRQGDIGLIQIAL